MDPHLGSSKAGSLGQRGELALTKRMTFWLPERMTQAAKDSAAGRKRKTSYILGEISMGEFINEQGG